MCSFDSSTEKCRFMDKRVREISLFFVAPPRVFPLSVCAHASPRTVLSTNTSSSVYGLLFPDWPCHTWSWRHAPVSREHKVTRKFVWFGHPEGFSVEYLPILASPKILGVLRSSASSTTSTAGSTTSSSRMPRQKEQQEMEMAKRTSRKPFPSTTRTATASWAWTSSKRWWANSGVPTRSFQFWSLIRWLRKNLCQNISFGVRKVCTYFTKPFIQTTYEVALEAVVHSARLGDIKGCVKIK